MADKQSITYRLVHEVGVIRVNSSGWKKELNIVAWNDKPAKYDIRDWNEDRSHMSKGVQLTGEEMDTLVSLYKGYIDKDDETEETAEVKCASEDESGNCIPHTEAVPEEQAEALPF